MTMKDFYRYQTGEKIRFSTEVPEVGSIYRSNGPLPYIPSYRGIDLKGILVEPAVIVKQTKTEPGYEKTPERVHEWEIFGDCMLLIDGFFVAQAPAKHDSGKKFTQTERLKFCRAIVWQLMNDDGSLKDQLALLSITPLPEPVIIAATEVIAVSAPVAPVDIPEVLNAYTHEGITGYPDGEIFKYTPDYDAGEYDALLINGMFEHGPSMLDNEIDTAFMDDIEKESIGEMFAAFNPVIIRQWTHGRMIITEEVKA